MTGWRARRTVCSLAVLLISVCRADPDVAVPTDTTTTAYSFAVLGDMASGTGADLAIGDLLRSVDASSVSFAIDLGDIKSAQESCTDDLYTARKALIDNIHKAVVVLPGYNDWVACALTPSGSSDPIERLSRLRELFDGVDASLGQTPIVVTRQSDMRRFRDFSENVRWQYGRVLFVGLNMPGSNNNFRFAAGRNGEFEDRVIANRIWLDRAFKIAEAERLAGVVVAIQGDPEFQRPLRPPDRRLSRRDGYYEFKLQLRELALRFHGQILLLHGGVDGSGGDEPLGDGLGKPLRNLVRVETFGSPNVGRWLHVKVDTRRPKVFSVGFEDVSRSSPALAEPPIPDSNPP